MRKPEAEVQTALNRLRADWLLFRGRAAARKLSFQTCPGSGRSLWYAVSATGDSNLHARIAATLEGQFPEIVETQPELMARHCAEAGLGREGSRLLDFGRGMGC